MNKIDSLKIVLEFYKELGFERLPINLSKDSEDSNESAVTSGLYRSISVSECRCSPINQYPDTDNQDSLLVTAVKDSSLDKETALNALREEIGDCQRCKLSKGRTHIVFGEGNVNAKIMFIGEAPGREEDIQARPFVGDAGQLLTRLIEKMGFKRKDVYIANIIKCRPPMNRDPQDDEIAACFPFLERQIEIISPRIVVSLGKVSAHTLLRIKGNISKFSISKVRGRFYEYRGIPVMPTFHPAYLLRNPKDKWLTWEDAKAVLKKLRG